MHDLNAGASRDFGRRPASSRNNRTIQFNRHAVAFQLKLLKQRRDRCTGTNLELLTIEIDGRHGTLELLESNCF